MSDIIGFKTASSETIQKIDTNAISLGANMPEDGDVLSYKDETIKWVSPASIPDPSGETHKKILINDNGTVSWTDEHISFGSGSQQSENNYITPKMLIAEPEDFEYSQADGHGFPDNYSIAWGDAVPPVPYPGFDNNAPVGTKKSYNMISTVRHINTADSNTPEFNYGWEETQKIPDPKTGSHNGHVLTYDSSEGIVWAAPAGGGSSVPAYTSNDDCAVLTVNANHDGMEWVGFPSLGSAGEAGYAPVLRTLVKYIVPAGHPIEDGDWVSETSFRNPGLPYKYISGEGNYANNDWAYGKQWELDSTKAIAYIDNETLCSMDRLDDSDIMQVEIRILIDSAYLPPFAAIRFTNETGNNVTVSCILGKMVNGIFKRWDEGIDGIWGDTLRQFTLAGTTLTNTIANNAGGMIQLLGDVYTIYTNT